jgi:transposase InsO family protein
MKIMVIDEFLEKGIPKNLLFKHVDFPKSSYYYTPLGTKAGKKVSQFVYNSNYQSVHLDTVLAEIKKLLSGDFVDYGYYKTYRYLKEELGLKIGSYRTYNLMKTNRLLKFQRGQKKRTTRNWVKELVPNVQSEFSFLEFDIKYVYIQGAKTNAQVLTIIDVFSRWQLGQYIANSIKSEDVINLFEEIFQKYPMPKQFVVRNDNGSQFEALIVQEYLRRKGVTQEFTKPATPEQNAHIESYHSIMESAVCQRIDFENIDDFKEVMVKWKKFYNFERIHGGLNYRSPKKFLESIGVKIDSKWEV